jgi:hypothetical protein
MIQLEMILVYPETTHQRQVRLTIERRRSKQWYSGTKLYDRTICARHTGARKLWKGNYWYCSKCKTWYRGESLSYQTYRQHFYATRQSRMGRRWDEHLVLKSKGLFPENTWNEDVRRLLDEYVETGRLTVTKTGG